MMFCLLRVNRNRVVVTWRLISIRIEKEMHQILDNFHSKRSCALQPKPRSMLRIFRSPGELGHPSPPPAELDQMKTCYSQPGQLRTHADLTTSCAQTNGKHGVLLCPGGFGETQQSSEKKDLEMDMKISSSLVQK